MVNFNLYQAKATDGEDKDKEEEIFIDLEDGDLEEVKDEKMQSNNFVEANREEWSVQIMSGTNLFLVFPSSAPIYKYTSDIFPNYLAAYFSAESSCLRCSKAVSQLMFSWLWLEGPALQGSFTNTNYTITEI